MSTSIDILNKLVLAFCFTLAKIAPSAEMNQYHAIFGAVLQKHEMEVTGDWDERKHQDVVFLWHSH